MEKPKDKSWEVDKKVGPDLEPPKLMKGDVVEFKFINKPKND